MFYELIRDDPGRSREAAKREPRAERWREREKVKKGKERGWRLQSNFNEHQGEYQIFFSPLVLSVDIQWHTALNHCHANKVFPIMPLVFGW